MFNIKDLFLKRQKKGEWVVEKIEGELIQVCSNCGVASLTDEHRFAYVTPYCPFCGAEMTYVGNKKEV